MVQALPGSLSEGAGTPNGRDLSARRRYASEQPPQAALSESQRECRPLVFPCQWITNQRILALKFFTGYVHRSTLPQSRIRSTAPSEREPGMGCAIQPGTRKLRRCGRFSSPLRRGGYHSLGKSGAGADAPTPLGVSGRDEIAMVYLAQASIWLWISAMMSSRPESRMVASMVATVCSGSWVPVIRMGRYSL